MPLLLPENLTRFGWNVTIDEAKDTVDVWCPRCKRPAFDHFGRLDDVAHVFHHYLSHKELPGRYQKSIEPAHKALSAMASAVECFTMHDMDPGDVIQILRFLGAVLVEIAPEAADVLMDSR